MPVPFDFAPDTGSVCEALCGFGVDLHHARHTIDAVAAAPEDAELLRTEPGVPLLRVRRRTYSAQDVPLGSADDRCLPTMATFAVENTARRPHGRRAVPHGRGASPVIELAVLDMAGTTVDEHGSVYAALREAVERTGATVDRDDLQTWMGTDKREALHALIGLGGGTPAPPWWRRRTPPSAASSASVTAPPLRCRWPVPARPSPNRARGIRVALATGFSADVADPLLASLGWSAEPGGRLDAVVTADEAPRGRPAPHMIHRAMEKTGTLDVRTVLTAGDTVVGLQAGTYTGAGTVVGVLTGALFREELERHPQSHVLDSVAGILRLPETGAAA